MTRLKGRTAQSLKAMEEVHSTLSEAAKESLSLLHGYHTHTPDDAVWWTLFAMLLYSVQAINQLLSRH